MESALASFDNGREGTARTKHHAGRGEMLSAPFADRSLTKAPLALPSGQRTVLLVDDDGEFRLALANLLRAEGHHVIEARSGEAALAVLDHAAQSETTRPDVIVVDPAMPRMTSVEFVRRLRKSLRGAQTPMLVMTAINDPMLPVRLDLPIVFKPDLEVVLDTIRRHLGQNGSQPTVALASACGAAS